MLRSTDISLVTRVGGSVATVGGVVAQPLLLREEACVVAQPGCDHGLHRHVP